MKPMTLGQVREVLSGSGASRFLETWGAVAERRALLTERLDEFHSQALTAEGRARLAEEASEIARTRAAAQQRRARVPGLDAMRRLFVTLESEALAQGLLARAGAATEEAAERRRRAAALREEAAVVASELAAAVAEHEALRTEAVLLDAYLGEGCLFFVDTEIAGGVYLVPLDRLELGDRALEPFVLHRLAPGASLPDAKAIRDVVEDDAVAGDDAAQADPLELISESRAAHRRPEKS